MSRAMSALEHVDPAERPAAGDTCSTDSVDVGAAEVDHPDVDGTVVDAASTVAGPLPRSARMTPTTPAIRRITTPTATPTATGHHFLRGAASVGWPQCDWPAGLPAPYQPAPGGLGGPASVPDRSTRPNLEVSGSGGDFHSSQSEPPPTGDPQPSSFPLVIAQAFHYESQQAREASFRVDDPHRVVESHVRHGAPVGHHGQGDEGRDKPHFPSSAIPGRNARDASFRTLVPVRTLVPAGACVCRPNA